MHHVARFAGIVVVLWSCAPIARGQDDPRAGAVPSSPSGANPGSEYLREQPPAFGFPPGERGWLAPPPSAPQVPAPNGWGHRCPFVDFRHGDPTDVVKVSVTANDGTATGLAKEQSTTVIT